MWAALLLATFSRIRRRLANNPLSRDKWLEASFRTIIRISGGNHASRKGWTGHRLHLSPIERSPALRWPHPGRRGGENPPVLRGADRQLGIHAGGEEGSRPEPRQILPARDHALRRHAADDYGTGGGRVGDCRSHLPDVADRHPERRHG